MKTVYVHAGYHKTGTTSIQISLTRAAATLAQNGVLYPASGRPESARFGQHELAWSLMRRRNYLPAAWASRSDLGAGAADRLFGALRAEIEAADCATVIISSEEFDCLDTSEIAELGERLHGYSVVPVVFVRRFPALIEASYKTSVIHGGLQGPIQAFAESQRSRLDLAQAVQDWRAITATGGMHLVNYDDPAVRGDALGALLACAGVPAPEGKPAETRWNQSYSAQLIELVRHLRLKGVPEPRIKAWLKRAPRTITDDRSCSLLTPKLHDQLDRRFTDEMSALLALDDPAIHVTGTFSLDREVYSGQAVQSLHRAILSLW